MNILFFAEGSWGGGPQSLLELVCEQVKLGNTCIVCTRGYNKYNEKLECVGAKTLACGFFPAMSPKGDASIIGKLKPLIKFVLYVLTQRYAIRTVEKNIDLSKVDIIHTNVNRTDIGCLIASRHNIPHVMHIREFGQEDYDCIFFRRNYIDFLNTHVDRFVAISNAVAHAWIQRGLDARKLTRIYNGIKYEDIIPKDIGHLADCEKLTCVLAGTVIPTKGQELCIEAMHLLPKDISGKIFIDFIGQVSPQYKKVLADRIDCFKLNNNIRFLPYTENLHQLLCKYDVGLMCSKSEGFGRVTAEYMHARLGVIASDSGANAELIHNGITGLLYSYGDCASLASCICSFYNDRKLLVCCADAAHQYAGENFTSEINARRINEVYKSLLLGLRADSNKSTLLRKEH